MRTLKQTRMMEEVEEEHFLTSQMQIYGAVGITWLVIPSFTGEKL